MATSIEQQSTARFHRLWEWAPIRLISYLAALVLLAIVAKVLTSLFVPPAPSALHTPLMAIRNLVLPVAMFLVYAALVHRIERRRATELSIRSGWAPLLVGLLTGAGMMVLVFAGLWMFSAVRQAGFIGLEGLTPAIAFAMATAMGEELLCRAILFRIVEEITGTTSAIIISAAIFGFLHSANPGATPLAIIAVAVEAGVTLALAYVLTRNVWLAVGIHMGWNFTQGYVFGAAVSGGAAPHSLLKVSLSGADWLTGGSFGPEASVVSLIVCAMVACLLILMIARKGGWQSTRLRLRNPATPAGVSQP